MSQRAEGCGQWLSAKAKRTTTQLAPSAPGKAKKQKKTLLNFASIARRCESRDICVSSSPLSPRTRKKLKNAKQSKIDNFLKEKPRSNVSSSDNKVVTKRGEFKMKENRTNVPIKRHREYWRPGYSTDDVQSNEQFICSQQKKISDTTEFNISGISQLGDSFDNSDELIQDNVHLESQADNNRDSLGSPTLTPPRKKVRSCESGPSLTERGKRIEGNKLLTLENESQSFHFSQWKRDQIAKSKGIQSDENFTEDSLCSLSSNLSSVEEESDLALNQGDVRVDFSETPPFKFTQWANQQIEECRRIQKGRDSPDLELYQSVYSEGQSNKPKLRSRKRDSEQKLTDNSDAEFDFSESGKNQEEFCKTFPETENSAEWESEKWGDWVYKTGMTASTSMLSSNSEFQFSEWVKGQLHQCRVTQEDN